MAHWIKGELYAKNQGPDSRDEKVICILSNLKDKHTDIVANTEVVLYAIEMRKLKA